MRTPSFTLFMLALAGGIVGCSSEKADTPMASTGTPETVAGSSSAGTTAAANGGGAALAGAPGTSTGTAADGGVAQCPALRPSEDSSCTLLPGNVCSYDEIECQCAAGTWRCAEPVDPNCPVSMPVHDSPCSVPEATECEFLADECECTAGRWRCESAEEDAGVEVDPAPVDAAVPMPAADASVLPCPDLRPVEGLSCTVAFRTCLYDTTSCSCPEGSWLCNESVDPTCPIEPPTQGTGCDGRADCDYFSIECECSRNTWNCKTND